MKLIKYLLILTTVFFTFFVFADCVDCEAYKSQVANDCDSIMSSCNSAISDLQNAHSSITTAISIADNQSQINQLNSALTSLSAIRGTLETLYGFAYSIKSTAQALQCSTNTTIGTCECAEYLSSISTNVATLKINIDTILVDISTIVDSLGTEPETISKYLHYISDDSINILEILSQFFEYENGSQDVPFTISDYASIQTNLLTSIYSALTSRVVRATNLMTKPLYNFMISDGRIYRSSLSGETPGPNGDKYVTAIYPYISSTPGKLKDLSLLEAVYGGFWTTFYNLSSLNNYAYTNFFLSSSINSELLNVSSAVSEITNQFSIFIEASSGASPVLSAYTSQDGSYHDYLTNYYIQVSGSSVSGSTPLTNWFNRIEMLLASLVFRDEGTNFVDSSDNASEFDSTLSQSLDTLSEAVSIPQSVTGKIDNMGQSFLGLLGEWQTIVSGNSLPSQFVLCDINLGSQTRDASGDSPSSSFRLETSLDSGPLRQFLDFCHAITTILFTMLFVWLSIKLLCFLLSSLAKLVQFCYLVYSALFGG